MFKERVGAVTGPAFPVFPDTKRRVIPIQKVLDVFLLFPDIFSFKSQSHLTRLAQIDHFGFLVSKGFPQNLSEFRSIGFKPGFQDCCFRTWLHSARFSQAVMDKVRVNIPELF